MELDEDINNEINLLKDIENTIDNVNNQLNKITENENFPDNVNKAGPKERAYFNWTCAYGVYTSYNLYLLLEGIKPKDHQISKEIQRLQDFRDKIRRAEGTIPELKNKEGQSKINKKAAEKMIKNIIKNK